MGYDFGFARLENRPETFPHKLSDDFGEKDLKGFNEVQALVSLIASRGFHPIAIDPREFRWKAPDGGSLNLNLRSASIGWVTVDTHTHWRFVLEVFAYLYTVYSDLVIVDSQTGVAYDAETFRAFIDSNYQEATDRVRRLASFAAKSKE
jgi:hypothetical protein